ncbi:hypothetical protein TBLA_0C00600 [Henningerozyma blattae CBS 6284]|uniref:Nuclear pore protein n=1 Tax=Henningerozyma blattae (strain ATCC 34711 / CBS 6284 / DSM 70876 / NBRC 10599 / NRRL Y-10934 / UCD 77-7) TaxID=1071380 RepID=I2H0H4_HENB6|nr:hypothetical protein TBLA_0C00600 [Tetrapisispora blattae CBS 6284]CCH59876.1 hypothetical protein TBLA_0C00600 [Tetrapisispora blattae CBS 6284]
MTEYSPPLRDGELTTNQSTKDNIRILNELIDASKDIPTNTSGLGHIQLSINEIKKRAQQLRSSDGSKSDLTKAHYLLAGGGLRVSDINSSVKILQSSNILEQTVLENNDGELDTYLKLKKDENVLSSIEYLLMEASNDFHSFLASNIKFKLSSQKYDIYENFGINVNEKDKIKEVIPTLEQPIWGSSGNNILQNKGHSKLNVNENFLIREKFERYAKIIHRFNNARQANEPFSLDEEIISMITTSNDSKNRQIFESWKIISTVKGSDDIVRSGKNYLEKQFLDYVNTLYSRNLSEGLPTNTNKIKSFIDIKLKNNNTNTWKFPNMTIVNGVPIWALIFYLLRAGLKEEALEVATNNKACFKKVEGSFLKYIRAYVSSDNHKLPDHYASQLHNEYNQYIKCSLDGDPYRLAVYKVIGRCDLTRKNISTITLNIEDWLWIHFMLIKDNISDNEPIYEKYSLEDFQNIILSYGTKNLNNFYFQSLLLSGLYESAIEYMYTISEIDAVHLALGLVNHGLLKTHQPSNKVSDDNIISNSSKSVFSFSKILGNYIHSFKYSDPRIAAEYLILLALDDTANPISVCHEAIIELILDSREFTILLGKINRDGTRIPGILEERKPLLYLRDKENFLHSITEPAARRADEGGRIHDSLLLYQLSEEYDIVVESVNKLLSDMLSNTGLNKPLVTENSNPNTNPILLAQRLLSMYSDNLEISKKVHYKNKETCILLLRLADARKLFLFRQWQNCLSHVEEMDLLPFGDALSARTKAQEFLNLDNNIIKNIPVLLIMVMKCISALIEKIDNSDYQSSAKKQQIVALKNIARNCIVYAGIIQYRMPREVYSTLIKIESSL